MKLHSLTLRPDARTPKGIRGRQIDAANVQELAMVDHNELGRCYLVHAKEQQARFYLPGAVESVELRGDVVPTPEQRRCAVCPNLLEETARGETCSRKCARVLGRRRTGR